MDPDDHDTILRELHRDLRVRWPLAIGYAADFGSRGAYAVHWWGAKARHVFKGEAGYDLRARVRQGMGCQRCGVGWAEHGMVGSDSVALKAPMPTGGSPQVLLFGFCKACLDEHIALSVEFRDELEELRRRLGMLQLRREQEFYKPKLKVPE